MADASHPFDARRRRPRDWGEALAALPLETPPLSVWTQIAARLDAADRSASDATAAEGTSQTIDGASRPQIAPSAIPNRRRTALSLRGWLALAASLSALALLPAIWFAGRGDTDASPIVARVPAAPGSAMPSPAHRNASNSTSDSARVMTSAPQVASVVLPHEPAKGAPSIPVAVADPREVSATLPIEPVSPPTTPQLASLAPPTVSPTPLTPTANAEPTTNEVDALPPGAVLVGDTDADVTGSEMEMLYAASAQLETLLTYTRDPRVETGPAAALASQIHTRLAKIDARLAMPGLSENEQHALWQARVGTLRQALAFESEQRALAAEGQVYEGQLVEVY
ncbi:MAG: hypothetical protein KA144_09190 [Xanthomonadaceae bacterium]|nr:hypothetical protein [Xanthomonadaceae bacterium]